MTLEVQRMTVDIRRPDGSLWIDFSGSALAVPRVGETVAGGRFEAQVAAVAWEYLPTLVYVTIRTKEPKK